MTDKESSSQCAAPDERAAGTGKVASLIAEIYAAKTLAMRDSLFDKLLDELQSAPPAPTAQPASAPVASQEPAWTIDTPEFRNLLQDHRTDPSAPSKMIRLIAHIAEWGQQQREAGIGYGVQKVMHEYKPLMDDLRGRAEKAEAALGCPTWESLALSSITCHFNAFIGECMDGDGNPQAPSKRALAHARACMPKPQSTAFNATPSTPEIENAATVGQWKDGHA
jgi:hypothetical protein